ncbi:hypothetical protein [Nocardia abscessus]|uniref:hypothetical protein n=1 Tax=Nocardia abscessus TaxID=120957 RepID=UPI001576A42D|nr:hypothetical protein [Nocardia abscessus]MCC3333052.1 hypothetical protein [Nocardia abscessus]
MPIDFGLDSHRGVFDDQIVGRVPGLNRRRSVAGDTLRSMCEDEYGPADLDTRVGVVAAANHLVQPDSIFSRQVVHFPS